MKQYGYSYKMKIGTIYIGAVKDGITHVLLGEEKLPEYIEEETAMIQEAKKQLEEYFDGSRKKFDILLRPKGTPFQHQVWKALQEIPYGTTMTYGEIAKKIGNPKASRAVGHANNQNPIAIIIPCHRVIGANGTLVGYAGGVEKKQALLELEGAI